MAGATDGKLDESGLVGAFYRGVTDTAELERGLELLADQLHCRSTVLLSLDMRQPQTGLSLSTGVFDEAARVRYVNDFHAFDPAPAAFARMPVGTASSTDWVLAPEFHRDSVFLNEFYHPLGLVETVGGMLKAGDGQFEMLGLHRGADRSAFTTDEMRAVERLLPHLGRSLQLRRLLLSERANASALGHALERLAQGVVVLDGSGTAILVNAAMWTIVRRGDGLGLDRAGQPLASDSVARRRIAQLLHNVGQGGAGGVVRVPNQSGGAYAVLVAPLPDNLSDPLMAGRSGALVFVHDSAGQVRPPLEQVQEAFDLTRGAADLALALAADGDLKSFAEARGVTIHTARFHLATALSRTGSRSQAELVGKVVRLLRDLALH